MFEMILGVDVVFVVVRCVWIWVSRFLVVIIIGLWMVVLLKIGCFVIVVFSWEIIVFSVCWVWLDFNLSCVLLVVLFISRNCWVMLEDWVWILDSEIWIMFKVCFIFDVVRLKVFSCVSVELIMDSWFWFVFKWVMIFDMCLDDSLLVSVFRFDFNIMVFWWFINSCVMFLIEFIVILNFY